MSETYTAEHLKDFERGEAAHKRGASLSDNPFPHHDRRHWDWELGWISADNPAPPHATELLTSALKWIRRIEERADDLPASFLDNCDPKPLRQSIEAYLSKTL